MQGQESERVLVDPTVSAVGDGGQGFLSDFRRMNVGLTRARNHCIILGSCGTLEQQQGEKHWLSKLSGAERLRMQRISKEQTKHFRKVLEYYQFKKTIRITEPKQDPESTMLDLTIAESFRHIQSQPREVECHKCYAVGHMAQNCLNSGGERQRTCRESGQGDHLRADCPNIKCRNCDQRGHIATVCPEPRKNKAGRGRWIPHQAHEKAAKEEEAAPAEENFAQHEEPKVSDQWKEFQAEAAEHNDDDLAEMAKLEKGDGSDVEEEDHELGFED